MSRSYSAREGKTSESVQGKTSAVISNLFSGKEAIDKVVNFLSSGKGYEEDGPNPTKDIGTFFINRAQSYTDTDGIEEYANFDEVMKEMDADIAVGDNWDETAQVPLFKVGDKVLVAEAPVVATFNEAGYFDGEEVRDAKIGRRIDGEWKLRLASSKEFGATTYEFDKDGNRIKK